MATTCPHGYPQDTCVICETLAASRSRASTAVAGAPARTDQDRGRWTGPLATRHQPAGADPTPPTGPGSPEERARRRLGFTPSVLLVVLAVIAVVGVAWAVAGLVFAILRIVELLAAVVVAGGIGYRVGRARGRRER